MSFRLSAALTAAGFGADAEGVDVEDRTVGPESSPAEGFERNAGSADRLPD
jgi:hypothetical protein